MATLLQALVGGVLTLVDAASVARSMVADTNGAGALSAGDLITAEGGSIVKADAATAKRAVGYVSAGVSALAAFSYYTDGVNSNSSGLTKGLDVFLAASGLVTTTPPEPASTQGWQRVGIATSTTAYSFVPGPLYVRA